MPVINPLSASVRMKRLGACLVWVAIAWPLGPSPAAAQNAPPLLREQLREERECRLTHLRNTKSPTARSYIEKACNFLALPTSDGALAQTERVFHGCVLDVLPGTEDDRNAVQLANDCKSRSWSD